MNNSILINILILFLIISVLMNVMPNNNIIIKLKQIFANIKNIFNTNLEPAKPVQRRNRRINNRTINTKDFLEKYLKSNIKKKVVQKIKDNIKKTQTIISNPISENEFTIIQKYLKKIINNKKINLKFVSINKKKIKKQILNNSILYKHIYCKSIFKNFDVVINIDLVAIEMSKDSIFLGPIDMGNKTGIYNIIKIEIDKFYPIEQKSKKKKIIAKKSDFKISYGDTDKENILLSDSIDSLLPDSFNEGQVSSYDVSSVINSTENKILI